ncbi:hypothetical protein ACJMK2_004043 [Sinanodonta woodiana]|uniref:MULE transposase domain-containing protein n=1 Tax=Sinanodonta woodiana TaxID=1069815 RepID=A0ABD3Y1Q5_SINWO
MALRFATSEKGNTVDINNKTLEIIDNEIKEKKEYSRSKRCHGRIHTIGYSIAKWTGEHNHSGNACRAEVLDAMHDIIDRGHHTGWTAEHSADVLNLASQPALGQLTRVNNMERVIRRARKGAISVNPLSLQDLVVPDEFKKTLRSQDSLLYDSGQARSHHWYVDGTFKTVPPFFAHLYTIHGLINNNIVPAIFVSNVFSKLKQLEPSMKSISVMTDFETATCLYKNIQLNGLQHRNENDADFAMPSLAFVPVEDVVLAFEELLSRVDFPLESQPVLGYFKDTWMGRPTRSNKRRPSRTPHSKWSCYDHINDDLPKTNNSFLQTEQGLHEANIEQSLAGQPAQPQKKRYRDAASRIEKIVETYKEIDLMDYLVGLSHNLSF